MASTVGVVDQAESGATMIDSPMLRTVQGTPTDYWNDSCSADELEYAIRRGATGATSNPNIVYEVLKKEKQHWVPRVRELAEANPTWSETEVTWAVVEEMAVRGAGVLAPVFQRERGQRGRLSLQTNPVHYSSSERMVEQAGRFNGLAPNMQVKFPATKAGISGIEEASAAGINVNATVCFTVAQAIAVAEAVERGLHRRARTGADVSSMTPVCTIMIGRLDDWLKVLVERDDVAVDPTVLDWAGIAAFKRAYGIFQERGYRTRLLAAAFRHRLHWTELVGGDVILTLTHQWQVRFNNSGIDPSPRIEIPVDAAIVAELLTRLPDFRRAYEPDGLGIAEFDGYGATVRTLRSFISAYHDLTGAIRDVVLPDPALRA
ncbi:MAG: transaldolase family protein [Acidimicrobiales bacterium]|jgi:transaldolase